MRGACSCLGSIDDRMHVMGTRSLTDWHDHYHGIIRSNLFDRVFAGAEKRRICKRWGISLARNDDAPTERGIRGRKAPKKVNL